MILVLLSLSYLCMIYIEHLDSISLTYILLRCIRSCMKDLRLCLVFEKYQGKKKMIRKIFFLYLISL